MHAWYSQCFGSAVIPEAIRQSGIRPAQRPVRGVTSVHKGDGHAGKVSSKKCNGPTTQNGGSSSSSSSSGDSGDLGGGGKKKRSNGRMLGGSGGKHNVLPVSVCSDLQGGGIVGLALAPAPVSACVAILFQNWMPMEHAGESGGSLPSQRRQQPPDLRPPHVLEGEGGGGRWPISTCPGQAGRPRRFGWLGQAPVRTRRASCHGNVSGGWAPSAIGVQAAPVVKRVATGWGSRGR